MSIDYYKVILKHDASNVEAIACLGTNFFYTDQPEVALKFYRYFFRMMNKSEF